MSILMRKAIFFLGNLFFWIPGLVFGSDSPYELLSSLVKEAESVQDNLVLGKKFGVTLLRTESQKETKKKQYTVKIYDKKNWIMTKKTDQGEFVIGQNIRYFFILIKKTDKIYDLIAIDRATSKSIFETFLIQEYPIFNPFIGIGCLKLNDVFSKTNEYTDLKIFRDDYTQITFEFFDSKLKNSGFGPVKTKIIYSNKVKKFSYVENIYNNYRPELIGKYSKSYTVGDDGNLTSINIVNEMVLKQNGLVYEKEEYAFNNFQDCLVTSDNYLEFYNLPSPSLIEFPNPPWPTSYWFYLSGSFLVIGGGGTYASYRLLKGLIKNAN